MNPNKTALMGSILIWVHTVCNVGHPIILADERAGDKRLMGEKGRKMVNSLRSDRISIRITV